MYPVYDTVEQGQEVVMLLVGLLEYECILYSHLPNRRTYTFIYFPKICSPIRHYSGLYVY